MGVKDKNYFSGRLCQVQHKGLRYITLKCVSVVYAIGKKRREINVMMIWTWEVLTGWMWLCTRVFSHHWRVMGHRDQLAQLVNRSSRMRCLSQVDRVLLTSMILTTIPSHHCSAVTSATSSCGASFDKAIVAVVSRHWLCFIDIFCTLTVSCTSGRSVVRNSVPPVSVVFPWWIWPKCSCEIFWLVTAKSAKM